MSEWSPNDPADDPGWEKENKKLDAEREKRQQEIENARKKAAKEAEGDATGVGVFAYGGKPKPRKNSLEARTVADLKERAKVRNIKGYSTMKKAELIAALRKK